MSNHQKRLPAPENYPIDRKRGTYVLRASGPHREGLPLTVVLRDLLGYADTGREVKEILSGGKVLVDGRVRKEPSHKLGLMDVLTFSDLDTSYRVVAGKEGPRLREVDDPVKKLVRVENKTTLKGGITQVNFHDGNNLETGEDYATRSSLLVTVPGMEVEKEIELEEGNLALVSAGKHAGSVAEIGSIERVEGPHPNRVILENDGEFETIEENVFVIGEDEPEVDIGE